MPPTKGRDLTEGQGEIPAGFKTGGVPNARRIRRDNSRMLTRVIPALMYQENLKCAGVERDSLEENPHLRWAAEAQLKDKILRARLDQDGAIWYSVNGREHGPKPPQPDQLPRQLRANGASDEEIEAFRKQLFATDAAVANVVNFMADFRSVQP